MFLVDDDIMIRPFYEDCPEFRKFKANPDILCLSLRMAPNYRRNGLPVLERNIWQWKPYHRGGESFNYRLRNFGYAMAVGWEIGLSCDIMIASDDAKMSMPQVRQGHMYGSILPYVIGPYLARRYMFTGDFIDAQEAYRLGLVSVVVPRDRLLAEAYQLARRIAHNPPHTIQLNKAYVARLLDLMGVNSAGAYGALLNSISSGLRPFGTDEKGRTFPTVLREQGFRAWLEARDGPFGKDEEVPEEVLALD